MTENAPSQTKEEAAVPTQYLTEDGHANVALLQDRTPDWLKATPAVVWIAIVLAGLYIYSNITPLWHTDLWGHLTYGRWILEHKAVPTVEPLMPLAKGMPFLDLPWLSQVIGFSMIQQFGITGIQFLNGLCIVTAAGLLTYAVYARTQNLGASLLTLFAFYGVSYQQFLVVRPQLGGIVCFALVFVMATSFRWRKAYTVAIPLVFALWANLHGSFFMGLLMLGALTVGRALDVLLKTKKLKFVFAEQQVRRLLLVTELSAAAVLLNPYGLSIYQEVFSVSGSVNLQSLLEWDPLTLRMKQGRAAFVLALGLVAMYRLSPRRVSLREALLLCGLGIGMLWHSRMILWWAPVAAYYLGLHVAAVWRSWRGPKTVPAKSGGLWTVVALGVAWIGFAYTPFGISVVHGKSKDPGQIEKSFRVAVSSQTPIDLTDYLNRHPPVGQIFNTYEWGDYLLWAGPKDLKVFVNSHAHVIPEEVWQDYLQIAHASGSWEEKLNRYSVNTVVLDHQSRKELIAAMEKLPDWEKAYSDGKGTILVRKTPLK